MSLQKGAELVLKAFGTNVTFGRKLEAGSHIDCVTLAPTLSLDGDLLIKGG